MNLNYSIIALDVDGTLLNDDYEVTEKTKQALRRAHQAGAKLVLCTGRGPANALPILEQLGLEGILITHNGAAVIQTPGPTLLQEHAFSPAAIGTLVRYCREQGIHFDAHTAFELFLEKSGEAEAAMYEKYMLRPTQVGDLLELNRSLVKFVIFGPEERMDKVERELPALQLPEGLHWIRSGDQFIDVMSGEASKGKALEELATQWNVPRERIMAMGNYYNDVEMLQFAGLGIAMDNSPEAVKKAADAVTLSNNEDGVYAALLKFGLIEAI